MKHIQQYDEFLNERFADKVKAAGKFVKDKAKKGVEKIKSTTLKGLFSSAVDFGKEVWRVTKREGKETQQAVKILRKMIRGKEVSDKEKEFFKKQAGDVAKILPLVAIQGLPGGSVAITPLYKFIGNKFGFDILPKSHKDILDGDEDEKKEV